MPMINAHLETSMLEKPSEGGEIHHTDEVSAIAWDPSGSLVVSGCVDASVVIHCPNQAWCQPLKLEQIHKGKIVFVSFSPDGKRIASLDEEGLVCSWSAVEGTLLNSKRHRFFLGACFFCTGELVTTTTRGQINFWDGSLDANDLTFVIEPCIRVIACNPVRESFASLGKCCGRIWLRNKKGTITPSSLLEITAPSSCAAYNQAGNMLAVGDIEGNSTVFDCLRGVLLCRLCGAHCRPISSVAFSAANIVATGSLDGLVNEWGPEGQIISMTAGHRIHSLSYHPNDESLVAGSRRGIVLYGALNVSVPCRGQDVHTNAALALSSHGLIDPECSICKGDLCSPVTLPDCGHSFCFTCIVNWTTSAVGMRNRTCPICRARLPTNCNTNLNLAKIVKALKQVA